MACKYHPDRQVVAICSTCSEPICDQCLVTVSGKDVCKSCLSEKLAHGAAPDPGYRVAPEPIPAERVKPLPVNGFFAFCFSLMPGAGHMYLGFMKKGLLLMTMFFSAIALTSCVYYNPFEAMFGVSICIIWFWSFFDAIQLKRKLRAGIPVSDDISAFTSFVSRNKAILILVGVIAILSGMAKTILNIGYRGFNHIAYSSSASRSVFATIAVVAVVAGIVFIVKSIFKRR